MLLIVDLEMSREIYREHISNDLEFENQMIDEDIRNSEFFLQRLNLEALLHRLLSNVHYSLEVNCTEIRVLIYPRYTDS